VLVVTHALTDLDRVDRVVELTPVADRDVVPAGVS
jgi:hypothetical protein